MILDVKHVFNLYSLIFTLLFLNLCWDLGICQNTNFSWRRWNGGHFSLLFTICSQMLTLSQIYLVFKTNCEKTSANYFVYRPVAETDNSSRKKPKLPSFCQIRNFQFHFSPVARQCLTNSGIQ